MMSKTLNILIMVLEIILMFGLFVAGVLLVCSESVKIPVKMVVMFFVPVWIMMFGWISDFNDRIMK